MNEIELKKIYDEAVAARDKHWREAPPNMDYGEYMNYMKKTDDVVSEASMNYRMVKTAKLEDHDDIGDLMTLEEFIECVESGGFIDYDGYGYYSNEKQQSDITIFPSDVDDGRIRKDFSHVKWYNR